MPSAPPNSAPVSEIADAAVGCQREHRSETQGDDDGPRHDYCEPRLCVHLREQREPDGREGQAGTHHDRRPNPAHDNRGQHGTDDEPAAFGDGPQARLQR